MLTMGLVMAMATGCVHARHDVQVQPYGTYQSNLALQEAANGASPENAAAITVYVGELPPGFTVEDGQLRAPEGASVLGAVSTNFTNSDAFTSFILGGFYRMNEDQKGLQTYCNVQAPLVWVTLTMWNYLPFRYPCIPSEGNSAKAVGRRKDAIVEGLRKGAVALGGDSLILTQLGDLQYVQAGTGRVVGGVEMTQGGGIIVSTAK